MQKFAGSRAAGRAYAIGDGLKQCDECGATFSTSSDDHSCVYYLQRLLRTVVGDTAFQRAQHNLDSNINLKSKDVVIELGTMEEIIQDIYGGMTVKIERKFHLLEAEIQAEQ